MNLAELWKLPVVYVCENNLYTEYTHFSETTAGDILSRAAAFGIDTEAVDGQDARAVYSSASQFVQQARVGEGPAFLLCNTYRFRGHHVGDVSREYYRSKEEEQRWMAERDPIANMGAWLRDQNAANEAQLSAIRAEVKVELQKAVEFAQSAPYPEPEEVHQDVYA